MDDEERKENPEFYANLRRCAFETEELKRLEETLKLLNSDRFCMCGLSTQAFEDVVGQFSEKITKHLTSGLTYIDKAYYKSNPGKIFWGSRILLLDSWVSELKEQAQITFDELVKTAILKAPAASRISFHADRIHREDEAFRQQQEKESGKGVAK